MRKITLFGLLAIALLLVALLRCEVYCAGAMNEIEIYSPVLSIETEPRRISIPLTITNLVSETREVLLRVTRPAKWSYSMLFREYNVSKVSLRGNQSIDLTLVLEPQEAREGEYTFSVSAYRDNQLVSNTLTITVKIRKPVAAITVESASPVVSGSPGSVFSFSFNIKNNSYKDLTLMLNATIPSGWTSLGFKPSRWETKVISDITVKAMSTYWGAVFEVYCPGDAEPKEYPIVIALMEPVEGVYEEVTFKADVRGTPRLTLKTEGDLLSYNVEAGGEIVIPLIIQNTGTVPLRGITLYCYAPSGWRTEIAPREISVLGKGEQVRAGLLLSPSPGAIAGDYSVEVRAWSTEASHSVTLRITVTKTAYWGVVGIAVIIVAVLGLMFVFWRFGRL